MKKHSKSAVEEVKTEIVSLTLENVLDNRMFCGRSSKYQEMYDRKVKWFRDRFAEGMRYKLYQVNGRNVGFIETIPGEYAWRAVDAKGYLFIHCFWVLGKSKGKGYGTQLLQDCLDDAQRNGFVGVAVVTSFEHWLPNRKIFLKHGFEQVDHAPPAFELLVKRFDPSLDSSLDPSGRSGSGQAGRAALPKFKRNAAALKKLPRGLTIFRSDQCPYIDMSLIALRQTADKLSLPVNVIEVRTCKEAQRSPCPYGVMGVYLDGDLVSYHPIGGKQLIEFIEKRKSMTT